MKRESLGKKKGRVGEIRGERERKQREKKEQRGEQKRKKKGN